MKAINRHKLAVLGLLVLILVGGTSCKKRGIDEDVATKKAREFIVLTQEYRIGEDLSTRCDKIKSKCSDSVYKKRFNISNGKVFDKYFAWYGSENVKCSIQELGIVNKTKDSIEILCVIRNEVCRSDNKGNTYDKRPVVFPVKITLNKDYKVIEIKHYSSNEVIN